MAQRRTPPKSPAVPEGEPNLLVARAQFEETLTERIAHGEELHVREIVSETTLKTAREDFGRWDAFNDTLLRRSFSTARPADTYSYQSAFSIGFGGPVPFVEIVDEFRDDVNTKLHRLKTLKDQLPLYDSTSGASATTVPKSIGGTGVFIVHGHDEALKQHVARTVERLTGTGPIILHEQTDRGRTIIEKFESHANAVGYAVILLTGDDRGGVASSDGQRPRARQNVVFEFGYFVGRLGRPRVTVLHAEGVELPSDLSGVLYTPIDNGGAWQYKLAKEMKAAGISVDLNKL